MINETSALPLLVKLAIVAVLLLLLGEEGEREALRQQMEEELQQEDGVFVSPNEIIRQTNQGNENGKVILPPRPQRPSQT